jgi:uncharacterized iron-regulated protein
MLYSHSIGFLSAALVTLGAASQTATAACIAPGTWARPADHAVVELAPDRLFGELGRRRVVLLGEVHDDADHHRWQLQTIAALYAHHPKLVLGFEMFPRRVQPVLDDWVAGRLTQEEFLKRSEWRTVWGHAADLYMPMFEFARMNRIAMVALNVDRKLTRQVGEKGWARIPLEEREAVSDPAPAPAEYLDELYQSYMQHNTADKPAPSGKNLDDPAFRRFVDGMLLWDRAMAQGLAERIKQNDAVLAIGIMGLGHLEGGYGVPRQLADLGVSDAAVLLPWETSPDCSEMDPRLATALFGLDQRDKDAQQERPRLGVMLDTAERGVRVQKVIEGSIAQQAGLRTDDIIETIASRPAATPDDVISAVVQQAPGTWLPMVVRRGTQTIEIVARFPPRSAK